MVHGTRMTGQTAISTVLKRGVIHVCYYVSSRARQRSQQEHSASGPSSVHYVASRLAGLLTSRLVALV